MSKIYESISELVGKTPLVRVKNYEKENGLKAKILVKLEYLNPAGSIKDRTALGMIEAAEKQGKITPGKSLIVESTSGNTGIALAAFAAAKGYNFRCYVQDGVSKERLQVMRAFGAEVHSFSSVPEYAAVKDEVGDDFIAVAHIIKESVLKKEPHAFFVDQDSNPVNPKTHYETTAQEIFDDTEGDVDAFVACTGTGGTATGVGKFFREKKPSAKIVAVQPQVDEGKITGVHNFTEVPSEFVPKVLDKSYFDEIVSTRYEDSKNAAQQLAKTEGILVGISSGAALWTATELAKKSEFFGKTIVVILADTGLRYLSTNLFE